MKFQDNFKKQVTPKRKKEKEMWWIEKHNIKSLSKEILEDTW